MASRQLRKLRKQQELLESHEKPVTKDESSDDEPVVAKPRVNLFAGFAALGDEGDGDVNDSEEEDAELNEAGPSTTPGRGTDQLDGSNAPAKKSKKKKSKKKKGKKPDVSSTSGPVPEATATPEDGPDEIDRALAELGLKTPDSGSAGGSSAASREAQIAELFHINFQHLKAINELRKMFGNTDHMVEMEQQPPQPRTRGAQRRDINMEEFLSAAPASRRGGSRANNTLSDTAIRNNVFVEGKKTWPGDSSHGLTMKRTKEDSFGFVTFTYAHEKNYEELETNFFSLVQMYDPMGLVYFLRKYPYHVSTLIQVSKVAKEQDQNNALAVDLIERALFTFGRTTVAEFRAKLKEGKARIEFYRPENRQLYLAGYFHIRNLTQKGTVLTALEWTKLLISLDYNDPYGLINFLHPLAIRANEAKWFVDLCTKTQLLDYVLPMGFYIKQTLILAYLQLEDMENARQALRIGMKKVPWLYCSLYKALNLDAPKCVWGIQPRDANDEVHSELYIHMTKDLWDSPTSVAFLKTAPLDFERYQNEWDLHPSPHPTLPTARFIYLDNTPSLMATLPTELIHGQTPNFDFDPLPPPRFQNVFSSKVQERPWTMSAGGGGAGGALNNQFNPNNVLGRALRRATIDRALADAQRGIDLGPRWAQLREVIHDEAWLAELRAEAERRIAEWRAAGGVVQPLAPGQDGDEEEERRLFQATVDDSSDDDDEEDLPGLAGDGNGGENQGGGLMNMLLRAAGLFGGGGGGGTAAPQNQDDFQGLPEQVYRALEDLELPVDMPGAWYDVDNDDVDSLGDYSAITGRAPVVEGGNGDGQGNRNRERQATVESDDEDDADADYRPPGGWH